MALFSSRSFKRLMTDRLEHFITKRDLLAYHECTFGDLLWWQILLLGLAWQASCCRAHAVAMVAAEAVQQRSLTPSVLGVNWVEETVILLIFSPREGG